MKFSVTQENLVKGLQIVNRIATTRSTLPVLGNILLVTDKGRLKLVTTDLELAIDTHIGAKVEIEGAITIPARTFSDFVTNNTDSTIDFELKDTVLHAHSTHFTAELKGIDATEFPTIPSLDTKQTIDVTAPLLKEAILQTVFATAQDETRPILGGVAVFVGEKEMKFVATDSYRLAEKKVMFEKGKAIEAPVVIPARALLELSRLITDETASVSLVIDKHQFMAIVDESHLISRLIEGSFPPYQNIIPDTLGTTVTVSRSEFISSLRMASLFSRDAAYNVTFNVGEKEVELKALSAQIGNSVSTVTASVTGEPVSLGFNAKFVLDALQVITSSAVQLSLQGPKDDQWFPGILKSTEDQTYQYIIMPLRTDS